MNVKHDSTHGYIYKITCKTSGKSYIGKTIRELRRRLWEHFTCKAGTTALRRAIKHYGKESFSVEIIGEYDGKDTQELNSILAEKEIYYINFYNTYKDGYNCTKGGEGRLGGHSEETKRKISETLKGRECPEALRQKRKIMNKGKHHSEEAKKHMREAFFKRSAESEAFRKQRIHECFYGKKRDPELMLRIGLKHKKPIIQLSINGEFIQAFDSATDAHRFNNKWAINNITACCKGRLKTSYGFIFKYKEDYICQ